MGTLEMDSEFMGREEDSRDWRVGRNCSDGIMLLGVMTEMQSTDP